MWQHNQIGRAVARLAYYWQISLFFVNLKSCSCFFYIIYYKLSFFYCVFLYLSYKLSIFTTEKRRIAVICNPNKYIIWQVEEI